LPAGPQLRPRAAPGKGLEHQPRGASFPDAPAALAQSTTDSTAPCETEPCDMTSNPTAAKQHPDRFPDWMLFFGKFLTQGTRIAALAPSSPWLAAATVHGIDFSRARCVVELGAGTGPITRELLRRSAGRCRVLVIERDADFCQR